MKSKIALMLLAVSLLGLSIKTMSAYAENTFSEESNVNPAEKENSNSKKIMYPVNVLENYKKALAASNSDLAAKCFKFDKADAELADLYVKKQIAIYRFFGKMDEKFGENWRTKIKTPILQDLILSLTLTRDVKNNFSIPNFSNIGVANVLDHDCNFVIYKTGSQWEIGTDFDLLKKAEKEKYADWLVANIRSIKKASRKILKAKDITAEGALKQFQSAYKKATYDEKTQKPIFSDMLGQVRIDQSTPKKTMKTFFLKSFSGKYCLNEFSKGESFSKKTLTMSMRIYLEGIKLAGIINVKFPGKKFKEKRMPFLIPEMLDNVINSIDESSLTKKSTELKANPVSFVKKEGKWYFYFPEKKMTPEEKEHYQEVRKAQTAMMEKMIHIYKKLFEALCKKAREKNIKIAELERFSLEKLEEFQKEMRNNM